MIINKVLQLQGLGEREREEVVHIPSIFGRFQLSRIAVMLKTSYVRELYNREENEGKEERRERSCGERQHKVCSRQRGRNNLR